ncbi:major facilitator protein [Lenzites betulinus]|nr:major facilitator protein [Lenzites betulinus]
MDPPSAVEKGLFVETASVTKDSVDGRSSEVNSSPELVDYRTRYPDVNEAKLMRKIDVRVVPMISILYLLAFLDRVNVSNAVLFNFKQDLKLTGNQFNTGLVVFFIPYVLFEIPSNIFLKQFKPHVWLPLCMLVFGLITVLQGFAQNFGGFVAARFFLGLAEAGFFPGCCYLLSMWYRRGEAQKRYSFFFSSTTLAGGFGGLLASAIGKLDGVRGYHGWRWIFILGTSSLVCGAGPHKLTMDLLCDVHPEGLLTIVVAVIAYFVLPDFPEDAEWLAADEKVFVQARLHEDVGHSRNNDPLTFKNVLTVLKDPKIIFGPLMYLGFIVPAYSNSYFAPTILQTFGHSVIRTQLLSVPPYACTFVFTMIVAAASDYTRHRFIFVVLGGLIALAGYVILLVVHDNTHLQYGALYIVPLGALSAMPVVLCWFETNLGSHHRRAIGTAAQIGFGNIGGIIAAYSFLAKDSPRYIPGYSINVAFVVLAVVSACGYYLTVRYENRKRDRAAAAGVENHLSPEEKEKLGDLNPEYRYYT